MNQDMGAKDSLSKKLKRILSWENKGVKIAVVATLAFLITYAVTAHAGTTSSNVLGTLATYTFLMSIFSDTTVVGIAVVVLILIAFVSFVNNKIFIGGWLLVLAFSAAKIGSMATAITTGTLPLG